MVIVMKILVFGSNGLVGNSLRRTLGNNDQYDVYFSTREDTNLFSQSETNLLIKSFSPDVVINAAAKVGGIHANNTYRSQFLLENLKINMNILESCIEDSDIFIVNLGSSCIYPLDSPNPIKEDYFLQGKLEPTNSPYAIAKIASIELAQSLKIQYGHKILNLMPTNLYGPNDNFSDKNSHVIPGLIARMHKAKIENQKIFKVWGTGSPLREFLYVDDLADSILFLIQNSMECDLLNVGSGKEITIKELSNLIKSTINYSGEIEFDETMPDGNPRKLLDSRKINDLGWNANVDIKQGLENTYSWFLNNYS
jgi:GDP-L-fucose synthase